MQSRVRRGFGSADVATKTSRSTRFSADHSFAARRQARVGQPSELRTCWSRPAAFILKALAISSPSLERRHDPSSQSKATSSHTHRLSRAHSKIHLDLLETQCIAGTRRERATVPVGSRAGLGSDRWTSCRAQSFERTARFPAFTPSRCVASGTSSTVGLTVTASFAGPFVSSSR